MVKLFELHEETDRRIKLQRNTQEHAIVVEVSEDYDGTLRTDTTQNFLNHCVENLAFGACVSIGCSVELDKWRSTHSIAEDLGIALGVAFKRLFYKKFAKQGANVYGRGVICLDDSLVLAAVGIEGRRNTFFAFNEGCPGAKVDVVEDMRSADLRAFIEGFFQGFPATCHVQFLSGYDPHHVWESAFHAIGEAIRTAWEPNSFRTPAQHPYYAEEGIADNALL